MVFRFIRLTGAVSVVNISRCRGIANVFGAADRRWAQRGCGENISLQNP